MSHLFYLVNIDNKALAKSERADQSHSDTIWSHVILFFEIKPSAVNEKSYLRKSHQKIDILIFQKCRSNIRVRLDEKNLFAGLGDFAAFVLQKNVRQIFSATRNARHF